MRRDAVLRICPFERTSRDAHAVVDDPEVDAITIVTPTTTHHTVHRRRDRGGQAVAL